MPLVRITHAAGKPPAYRRAVADGVHAALVETLNVPADDRFQIVTEQPADGLIFDANYLGIQRSPDVIFIQVFLRRGRTAQMKQNFYRRVTERLTLNPGLAANDVFIALSENDLADWSFGQGRAQYVEAPPRPFSAPQANEDSKQNAGAIAAASAPVSGATLAGSAGAVLLGGFVMLSLAALLYLAVPERFQAALAEALPGHDLMALANFTG